jgi:hypothetical protein
MNHNTPRKIQHAERVQWDRYTHAPLEWLYWIVSGTLCGVIDVLE